MSASSASMSLPIPPDLTKEAEAFIVRIAAGAGVAAVVNPAQPQSAFTVFNASNNWVRLVFTWSSGIVSAGTAATRVAVVPPGSTYSADGADEGNSDNATGSVGFIDSISVSAVDVPVAAGVTEVGTLALAAAATAGHVAVNFLTV